MGDTEGPGPQSPAKGALLGAAAVIGVVEAVVMINDPNKGLGLPITIAMLAIVAIGMGVYISLHRTNGSPSQNDLANLSVLVGVMLIVILVTAFGGVALLRGLGQIGNSDGYPVTLTVGPLDENLNVYSSWRVNREPELGNVRFLVAVVPQQPGDYTDYFPKAELAGKGREPTSITFSLLAADPNSRRRIEVISVPNGCAPALREAIQNDRPLRETPCRDGNWSTDSKSFEVIKQ